MLRSCLHILLAFLLLISSSGLVLSQHFCLGELKSVAFFAEATPCHKQAAKRQCPHHPAKEEQKPENKCCDTATDFLQLDVEQLSTDLNNPFLQSPVLLAVLISVLDRAQLEGIDRKTCHYLNYKPPLIVCDLPVSFQAFLC